MKSMKRRQPWREENICWAWRAAGIGTVKVGERGQIVIPKDARALFGIRPGDTLLILGDEKSGIIVTRPEVVSDMAQRVFQNMEEET